MSMEVWFSIIKDFIFIIAAVITAAAAWLAAAAAWRGLESWQHELKWKAEFNLALELLQDAYKAVKIVETLRHSLPIEEIYFGASKLGVKFNSMNREEASVYAFLNDVKRSFDAIQEFEYKSLEADILWNNKVHSETKRLLECLEKFNNAMDELLERKNSKENAIQQNIDITQEAKELLFAKDNPENEFSERLKIAVTGIKDAVHPYLNRREQDTLHPCLRALLFIPKK